MHVVGTSIFHVGQSGVLWVSGGGVLASAAGVIVVEITAMRPAVVRIVVSALGAGQPLPMVGGAMGLPLRWRRGLRCQGLDNALLEDCCDISGRRGHSGVGDNAWKGCCVRGSGWAG